LAVPGVALMQMRDTDEKQEALREASEMGGRLVAAIREKQTYLDQEIILEENHEVIRALMLIQKDEWPFEYNYWKEHWGLED